MTTMCDDQEEAVGFLYVSSLLCKLHKSMIVEYALYCKQLGTLSS